MTDPNDISLGEAGPQYASRRDLYAMYHISNVIRKNILCIAPDVEKTSFVNFIHGSSPATKNAMLIATNNLPKTITKSVVASLGKYSVESRDNITFSPKFDKIFTNNIDKEMVADFFTKNLTTACCNEKIVFLVQPYLVFRYDLKRRESWFDRCRFIWMGCVLFRLPALLPVVAAQFFLYSIKILIEEPSLSRKEEIYILTELLRFLPGVSLVAKPPFGTGLSVWYREMAHHRRIVLEAILSEAQNGMDIRFYNPPYSMMYFDAIEDVIKFIENELKVCDKEKTVENRTKKKRSHKEKDAFGEESDIDEEDRELLQLGGCARVNKVEMDDDEIEEDVEEVEEVEEIEEMDGRGNETMKGDDDDEVYSETFTEFMQTRNITIKEELMESSQRGAEMIQSEIEFQEFISLGFPFNDYLMKKLTEDDNNEEWKNLRGEGIYDVNLDERKYSHLRDSYEWNGVMEHNNFPENEESSEMFDYGVEEEKNDEAIGKIFDTMPDLSEDIGCEETYWDPSNVLDAAEIERGLAEAQNLFVSAPQTISYMNLNVPMTPIRKENDQTTSSNSQEPSLEIMKEVREMGENVITSFRSDNELRNGERRMSKKNPLREYLCVLTPNIPAHIPRAPMKRSRVEEEETEDEDDEDEMEEEDGEKGGRGPMTMITKMEEEEEEEEEEDENGNQTRVSEHNNSSRRTDQKFPMK